MKKINCVLFTIIVLNICAAGYSGELKAKKDTPPYDVVAGYIRSLGAIHRIQQTALREQQESNSKDNPLGSLFNNIRSSTAIRLELTTSIKMFESMKISREQFEDLIPMTIYLYKEKLKLYDEAQSIAKKLVASSPSDLVRVQKMAARMPEITASINYLDETIFKSMVLVFALLIDDNPDAQGHMSHLNITNEQRNQLKIRINTLFGESLDQNNQNWTVASASVLKAYLEKDYVAKDDWYK